MYGTPSCTRAGTFPQHLDHARHKAQHVVEVDGVGGAQDAGVEAAGRGRDGGAAARGVLGGRSCRA